MSSDTKDELPKDKPDKNPKKKEEGVQDKLYNGFKSMFSFAIFKNFLSKSN